MKKNDCVPGCYYSSIFVIFTLEISSEKDNMWIIFQFMAHVSFVDIQLWYTWLMYLL